MAVVQICFVAGRGKGGGRGPPVRSRNKEMLAKTGPGPPSGAVIFIYPA